MADDSNSSDNVIAPGDVLNKLSSALVQISRGDPLVALRNEIDVRFRSINVRFDALDKATELQHQDMVRVPTQVQIAVSSVRELLEQKIETTTAKLAGDLQTHNAQTTEKFSRVDAAFTALATLTDKLSLANATALTAALSAAEKAVGEQNRSSAAAITKSEQGMLEALKQLQSNFQTEIKSLTAMLTIVQSRLDRGEAGLAGAQISKTEFNDNTARTMGIIGVIVAIAAVLVTVLIKVSH